MNEERLREAHRGLIREPGAVRDGCPSPEALEALVLRRGPEPERLGTMDHVMACAACRRELDLLRAIEQTAPRRIPFARPLALAATVVLAVAAGLTWRATRPATDPLRGDAPAVQLLTPADATIVPGTEVVPLAWRPVAGALRYEIEFVDGEDRVAYRHEGTDTTAAVGAADLPVPGIYRWRVKALLPAGAEQVSPYRRVTRRAP